MTPLSRPKNFAEELVKTVFEDDEKRTVYTLLKQTNVTDINSVTTNVSVLGTFADVGDAMDFASGYDDNDNMSWRHNEGTFFSTKSTETFAHSETVTYLIQSAPIYED